MDFFSLATLVHCMLLALSHKRLIGYYPNAAGREDGVDTQVCECHNSRTIVAQELLSDTAGVATESP